MPSYLMRLFKLIVHSPPTHTEALLTALGNAGAGQIGNYTHCSFIIRGTGRFKAGPNATPHIGQPGEHEEIEEDQISVSFIPETILPQVIAALKATHPYEEPAFEILELHQPATN